MPILDSIQEWFWLLRLSICKKILLKIIKPCSSHWTKTSTRCFQNNSSRKPICRSKWTPAKAQIQQLGTRTQHKIKGLPQQSPTQQHLLSQKNENSIKTYMLKIQLKPICRSKWTPAKAQIQQLGTKTLHKIKGLPQQSRTQQHLLSQKNENSIKTYMPKIQLKPICRSKWTPAKAQIQQLGTKTLHKIKGLPQQSRTQQHLLSQKNENSIKTFGLRMELIYKEAALPITKIHKTTLFKTPPLENHKPENRLESLQTQQKSHPPNNIPRKIQKNQRKISQLHPYLHWWI